MKVYCDADKIPTKGARFSATSIVDEYNTTPKIPGGTYYVLYSMFYKLSNNNWFISKVINYIFNLAIILLFLFWIYKRFNILVFNIITLILLSNSFLLSSMVDYWNPNYTLVFSFIFLILLVEYISDYKEIYVRLSSVFIFPVLAIMSQTHINAFLYLVPTLIIYLIINLKKTKNYILLFLLGVFVSFLLYLPYLIEEINNGFINTKMIFNGIDSYKRLDFPPLHALIIFSTNEMSIFYGGRFNAMVHFWFVNPFFTIGILFLIINLLFSAMCFCLSLYYSLNIRYEAKSIQEKNLIYILRFLFLFVIVNIIILVVLKMKSGPLYYLNCVFAFSFLPIIFFFTKNYDRILNNKKLKNIVYIYFLLNTFMVSIQMIRYIYGYERPYNVSNIEKFYEVLHNESNKYGDIAIVNMYIGEHKNEYRDISSFFYTNYYINENSHSENVYILFDKISSYNYNIINVNKNIEYLNSNAYVISSNNRLFLYKYTGNLPIKFPN
ncbi:hypothetical protein [Brachyspira pilosicoli]|uniref:hypothetical protein n=1 Tax=Brachyspira pilosicoli TaxID=52584 RepID=UPI001CA4CA46|nr:hypothetical protein [Brachyspira pilosicoli]MBW5396581.1 hypothetical protein [Brachyspira pilosicoli]